MHLPPMDAFSHSRPHRFREYRRADETRERLSSQAPTLLPPSCSLELSDVKLRRCEPQSTSQVCPCKGSSHTLSPGAPSTRCKDTTRALCNQARPSSRRCKQQRFVGSGASHRLLQHVQRTGTPSSYRSLRVVKAATSSTLLLGGPSPKGNGSLGLQTVPLNSLPRTCISPKGLAHATRRLHPPRVSLARAATGGPWATGRVDERRTHCRRLFSRRRGVGAPPPSFSDTHRRRLIPQKAWRLLS